MRSPIDPDAAYRVIAAKDPRYDGLFVVGVLSTGTYCRPSCPAPLSPLHLTPCRDRGLLLGYGRLPEPSIDEAVATLSSAIAATI